MRYIEIIVVGFEILCCKFCYIFRIVGCTAEHIQIDGAAGICKMCGDERGFNELGHAKALYARLVTKEHNLCFAIATHFDAVAKNYNKLADRVRVLHECQVAVVQVNAR